jgi:hypothetical protein
MKFVKYERQYILFDDDHNPKGRIDIYFNFYSRKNYYEVNEKTFEYLKDAKAYCKECAQNK